MSPRHSAGRGRRVSAGTRAVAMLAVTLLGVVGAVAAAAQFADPARPRLSPTVSDPAMLAAPEPDDRADPGRDDSVSRSSARGASARPASRTASAAPTAAHPTGTAGANRPTQPNTPPPGSSPASSPNASYQQQVLDLTNRQRATVNCPPLRMDFRLQAAAQGHSQDMADKDYFAHNDPDGTTPWDRAKAAGYPDPSAENIALGYPTPAEVMDAWMNSPGHRANILSCDSHDLGVGYVVDPNRGAIWTQLFGFG
ncbi:MAG TPA: CAP domain-containing protein [Mycobacteriales bacterium]|nr:CAP domain-containing protein [Mycobacteriales bacterium]